MAQKKATIDFKVYTRKELLLQRDSAIQKEFLKWTKDKHLDADFVIHEKLQTKFFVDPDTLWRIVRETYKRKYHKKQ